MTRKILIHKSLLVLTLIALLPNTVQAGPGMSEEQMQQMMEHAQKMQECMAKIDQSAMDALAAKGEKIDKEIKALCAAGKRNKAQKTAMAYGKEISSSKEMKAMKKCGEMAKGMMAQMPMQEFEKDYEKHHVCDGM